MKKLAALLIALTLLVSLGACGLGDSDDAGTPNYDYNYDYDYDSDDSDDSNDSTNKENEDLNEPDNDDSDNDDNAVSGNAVRSDFKKAMDSYEEFFKDYCEVVKAYQADPTNMELLTEYTEMIQQYTKTMEDMEAWEGEELNDAELLYYAEVNKRISDMLLDAVG